MFDFLEAGFTILPWLALSAAVVAIVGHRFGTGGAISAGLALLLTTTVFLTSLWHPGYGVGKFAMFIAAINGTSALIIAVPMLILTKEPWLPRRLIAGLMGALVASLVLPIISLFASCEILADCL